MIYEKTEQGYGAYPPDLPGVGVTASSREECEQLIRDAIAMHIEILRERGFPVPEPNTAVGYADVA